MEDPNPAPTTKFQEKSSRVLAHFHASHFIRSATATVLMVVGVLAPFTLVHGFAAPHPDRISRATIAEVANLTQEDTALKGGLSQKLRLEDEEEPQQLSRVLAKKLLARAAAAETNVTQDMKRLENDDMQLQGLDYRFKGEESLIRKIESDAEKQDIALEVAAKNIHDVLRYTLTIDADRYQEAVPNVLSQLTSSGYTVEKFNNSWGGKYYQGVNVQLESPDGVPVELQLHTPQSFAVKQASHGVYEIRRDPASTPAEVAKATRLSLAYNAQVRTPEGAEALSWPAA
ncbi:MAG: hypothetical protein MR630_10180 [Selenomonas sp.]|uniref:hypothetical protein n=1 Tax=Selenomonas sp. TaxID=2053611 RepID=UPI0026014B3F|nr:hypothetical protein [Selenomonas sp.]MCI6099962.1 hypothetical protein [Selenomonas sp.]MCI6232956.1 hypothetical protein [Selenomonas sp.]